MPGFMTHLECGATKEQQYRWLDSTIRLDHMFPGDVALGTTGANSAGWSAASLDQRIKAAWLKTLGEVRLLLGLGPIHQLPDHPVRLFDRPAAPS